ncbi:hypothetical protein BCR42DRAFT_393136 [Absidia repens]|uniref:Uncharacterized protein n=1 Tax=Absidia repens TaxID=90262 RepID=A0A1X2IEV3_9FUNG|nr:hypothetical protein BCR42DRAFT_393136 [Absidia repens]
MISVGITVIAGRPELLFIHPWEKNPPLFINSMTYNAMSKSQTGKTVHGGISPGFTISFVQITISVVTILIMAGLEKSRLWKISWANLQPLYGAMGAVMSIHPIAEMTYFSFFLDYATPQKCKSRCGEEKKSSVQLERK